MDNWGQGTFTLCVSRLYRRAVGVADVSQLRMLSHLIHGCTSLFLFQLFQFVYEFAACLPVRFFPEFASSLEDLPTYLHIVGTSSQVLFLFGLHLVCP